ncbi:MAG: glycerophosphodiester phosphodiesterase family protein [Maricaulaceae bacterium]
MYLYFKYSAAAALALSLLACSASETKRSSDNSTETHTSLASYPLRNHFNCLPETAALLAAHRGTARGHGLAENAKLGLEALIKNGTLLAEIDIAKTKDETHILFHDGVWENDSTGRGAIASTTWDKAQTFLLNDTTGKLTSETPIRFEDYLNIAKDRIYLEIDFKSSADYRTVIKTIRKANMTDKVILISYSDGQARKLAQLAPDMLISVSVNKSQDINRYAKQGVKLDNITAWTGRNGPSHNLSQTLREKSIPALVYPSQDNVRRSIKYSDIIVTDYALNHGPIIGKYKKSDYEKCLKN